jgi:hypothetical protein
MYVKWSPGWELGLAMNSQGLKLNFNFVSVQEVCRSKAMLGYNALIIVYSITQSLIQQYTNLQLE